MTDDQKTEEVLTLRGALAGERYRADSMWNTLDSLMRGGETPESIAHVLALCRPLAVGHPADLPMPWLAHRIHMAGPEGRLALVRALTTFFCFQCGRTVESDTYCWKCHDYNPYGVP